MLWYQMLLPAMFMALIVRLDAVFLGPYWSWLQLIPDYPMTPDAETTRVYRRRALTRRVAIPGIVGFALTSIWPTVYGSIEAAIVSLVASVLLLWPLAFADDWHISRKPAWLAWLLYGLLIVMFTAAGLLGGIAGSVVRDSGGFLTFVRDEGAAILITAVIMLFARDATDRATIATSTR